MLVVTFTKAAAAEMRERVSRAIDSLKEQKPDDENLQRQSTLVHNALITTIDSFCLFVVQNNFAQLNLDPDFRIGDQAELKLMLRMLWHRYLRTIMQEKTTRHLSTL